MADEGCGLFSCWIIASADRTPLRNARGLFRELTCVVFVCVCCPSHAGLHSCISLQNVVGKIMFLSTPPPPPQKIPAQLKCHLSLPLSCFMGATCLSCLKAPLSQSERTPLNYIWGQINSDAKWISLQKSTSGLSALHFRVSPSFSAPFLHPLATDVRSFTHARPNPGTKTR